MVWKKDKKWEDAYEKKSRSSYHGDQLIYVARDKQTNDWYFTYGQARINYKFHKNKKDAIKDMKKYMRLHK